MTRKLIQAAWLAVLTVLAGCAGSAAPTTALPASTGANAQSASEYIIGPGDQLEIVVWQNAELTRTMPVRPDGRIAMPLVGDTVAVGKTPQGLATELQEKLKPFVREPLVTIIPTAFTGLFTLQVRVIGEAATPRAVAYRASMTALDALIEVGGLTRFADGDRAVLVRRVNGQQQSFRVRLDSLVRDGDITQNVDLQPGDILIIPQRYF